MLAALLCAAAHDNAQVCASGHASGRCEFFGDLEALRLKAGYCELLGLGHGLTPVAQVFVDRFLRRPTRKGFVK